MGRDGNEDPRRASLPGLVGACRFKTEGAMRDEGLSLSRTQALELLAEWYLWVSSKEAAQKMMPQFTWGVLSASTR